MRRDRFKIELLYHDLKGPLAIIETGITALLNKRKQHGTLTNQQEKVLQRVLRNTKIARFLVDDTLEIGRSEYGTTITKAIKISTLISEIIIEIFDLINVDLSQKITCDASLRTLQNSLRNQGFYLSVNQPLWEKSFILDEKKVKQILRNLLLNAMKYKTTRVTLEIDEKEESLFFSVADDGKGIPPSYHKKIFEKYFQLDDAEKLEVRGHGLGLAGSLMLIEDLGGKLCLESDGKKGATFMVYLPVSERQ